MQKREGFRADIRVQETGSQWAPQPRENATLTASGDFAYMIGGMN